MKKRRGNWTMYVKQDDHHYDIYRDLVNRNTRTWMDDRRGDFTAVGLDYSKKYGCFCNLKVVTPPLFGLE